MALRCTDFVHSATVCVGSVPALALIYPSSVWMEQEWNHSVVLKGIVPIVLKTKSQLRKSEGVSRRFVMK